MGRAGGEDYQRLVEFDWDPSKLGPPMPIPKPEKGIYWYHVNRKTETWTERVERMLLKMQGTVTNCSMCPLGRQMCTERDTTFAPHVFSNMRASKWMVVGQNPGFNECMEHEPFVGDAGKYFDAKIAKYGLIRSDFYISNAVKCHTQNNTKPTYEHVSSCEPILRMELMLLKPKLVITLGAVAFGVLCPKLTLSDSFGKIHKSEKFGVQVYPIYHPSPRNLDIDERKQQFEKDISLICRLILAHRKKHNKV